MVAFEIFGIWYPSTEANRYIFQSIEFHGLTWKGGRTNKLRETDEKSRSEFWRARATAIKQKRNAKKAGEITNYHARTYAPYITRSIAWEACTFVIFDRRFHTQFSCIHSLLMSRRVRRTPGPGLGWCGYVERSGAGTAQSRLEKRGHIYFIIDERSVACVRDVCVMWELT